MAIEQFLAVAWRTGALLGSSSEDAFSVACDRTTMTRNGIGQGRVICLIGAAALKPAEFVVFRIGRFEANRSAEPERSWHP